MVKILPPNAGSLRDVASIPGSGRSPRGGDDYLLQYSYLGNPEDRGAWWATVHEVRKESNTSEQLNDNNNTLPTCGWTLSVEELALVALVVQSLSHVQLFETSWTAAGQASLSITISRSLLKLMSIKSVTPSILCRPLLLLLSIFPSIRAFSHESLLHIRWPKYWF